MTYRRLGTFPFATRAAMPVAVLLVALSCGRVNDDSAAGLVVSVDSTGAHPVIRSTGHAPLWRVRQVYAVASSDSGPTQFGHVSAVLLQGDGTVLALDPTQRRILRFGSGGRFTGYVGSAGAGPGEYAAPYSIAFLRDSIAVLDPGNARIGLFDPSGGWVRSWPVQPITGGSHVRLHRATDDAFWALGIRTTGNGAQRVWVRHGSEGPTDTMPVPRLPPAMNSTVQCTRPDGMLTVHTAPFGLSLHAIPGAGRERVVGLSDAYRLAFINPAGDTLREIVRAVVPMSLSDEDWDRASESWRSFRQRWPTAICDRAGPQRPATMPVIERLFFDDVGRLWVENNTISGHGYDVFDEGGRLLASIVGLPASGAVEPSVRSETIAIVTVDSVGLPRIEVFRLTR